MKRLLHQAILVCLFLLASNCLNSQIISTVSGTIGAGFSGDGGLALNAQLNLCSDVARDLSGNIYIADQGNQRIRKINTLGNISTFAGTGVAGYNGDGGAATSAQLNNGFSVAADALGNIYIADYSNHRVRKVNTSGVISTFAGTGVNGFSGDGGAANSAQLSLPFGIAVDASGNVYISEAGNNRIRKVNPAGIISTFAGTGVPGFSGDGGAATLAQINSPRGVAIDGNGNVYIGDMGNQRVRKISTSGTITTFAGNGIAGFSGDGGVATSAQLTNPHGISFDAVGNVYIGDAGNHRIRKVNALGNISTWAGTGVSGFSGDGGAPTSAQLFVPADLIFDPLGNAYIADCNNHRIRKVTCVSPTISVSSGSICTGSSYTIIANGASTYTYQGGSSVVSPTSTTSFSVVGTGTNGCVTPSASISNVTVNALPSLTTVTSSSIICGPPFQQTATLTASGANTYTWNPGGTGTNIAVSPSVTTTYTIIGTDANGCTNTSVITQSVSTCASVSELPTLNSEPIIYPNPFNNKVNIITLNSVETRIQIFNALGSLIYSDVRKEKTEIDLGDQAAGIYIVRIGSLSKKIIKE